MRIPTRYHSKTLENLQGCVEEIRQARLALAGGGSVFVFGGPGAGKTHLAVGLMWEWVATRSIVVTREDGYPYIKGAMMNVGDPAVSPIFLPSTTLFAELKDTFDGSGKESGVMKPYATGICLALDDIGAEQITDWKRAVLYTLIDQRYRDMQQTIITSNLTLDEIDRLIDGRIASRICEMGAVIHMNKQDYRIRMGK